MRDVNAKSRQDISQFARESAFRLWNFLRFRTSFTRFWLPSAVSSFRVSAVSLDLSFSLSPASNNENNVIDVPSISRKDARRKNERVENDPPEGTYVGFSPLLRSLASSLSSSLLLFPSPPRWREDFCEDHLQFKYADFSVRAFAYLPARTSSHLFFLFLFLLHLTSFMRKIWCKFIHSIRPLLPPHSFFASACAEISF